MAGATAATAATVIVATVIRGDRRGGRRDRDRDFAPREVRAPTDTESEEVVAVEEDSE